MIYVSLNNIRCNEETDEVGADEPDIIIASVDLKSTVNIGGFPAPIPASAAFRYGPFEDVDQGEQRGAPFLSFWGLRGEERALADPNDAIFVAALMENDDGDPEAARGLAQGLNTQLKPAERISRPKTAYISAVSRRQKCCEQLLLNDYKEFCRQIFRTYSALLSFVPRWIYNGFSPALSEISR